MGKPECPRKLKKIGWSPNINWSAKTWVQAKPCCCLPSYKPYPIVFLQQKAVVGCWKKIVPQQFLPERMIWFGPLSALSFLPPLTHRAKPVPPMQCIGSGWWGLPRNWLPPLWALPSSRDHQRRVLTCSSWSCSCTAQPQSSSQRTERIKGLGEVRKSCSGETERKNWQKEPDNTACIFVTLANCSYIGQRVTAGNFLKVFDS